MEWIDHPLFSEAKSDAEITLDNWVPVTGLPVPVGKRFLLDYSAIVRFDVPITHLIGAAEWLADAGIRTALLAPNDTIFGIARQVLIMSRLEEGVTFAAFKDRASAEAWLLGPME